MDLVELCGGFQSLNIFRLVGGKGQVKGAPGMMTGVGECKGGATADV